MTRLFLDIHSWSS